MVVHITYIMYLEATIEKKMFVKLLHNLHSKKYFEILSLKMHSLALEIDRKTPALDFLLSKVETAIL